MTSPACSGIAGHYIDYQPMKPAQYLTAKCFQKVGAEAPRDTRKADMLFGEVVGLMKLLDDKMCKLRAETMWDRGEGQPLVAQVEVARQWDPVLKQIVPSTETRAKLGTSYDAVVSGVGP